MSENEAIERCDKLINGYSVNYSVSDAFSENGEPYPTFRVMAEFAETCKKALEEIQAYRAIGTIEELKALKLGRLGNKGFITIGQTIEEFKQEIRANAIDEFAEKFIYKTVCEGCSGCCGCYEEGKQSECEDWKTYMEIAEQMKGEK